MDFHVGYLLAEFISEDGIAIAQQVARKLVKREPVPQLLSRPLRGGMGGHVAVDNATPVVGQDQKHVEYLETDGGGREEINEGDLPEVVLEESVPGLRRRFTAADYVLGDTALADVDAELTAYRLLHDRHLKMRGRYSRQPVTTARHDLRQKVAGVTVRARP